MCLEKCLIPKHSFYAVYVCLFSLHQSKNRIIKMEKKKIRLLLNDRNVRSTNLFVDEKGEIWSNLYVKVRIMQ